MILDIFSLAKKLVLLSFISFLLTSNPAVAAVLGNKQSGTVTMLAGETSITVNLSSAVNMSQSVLFFSTTTSSNASGQFLVGGELATSTSLQFHRNASGSVVTISWQVLEFSSGVSVQRGVRTAVGGTINVPITAVNTANSFPLISYNNNGTTLGTDDGVTAEILGGNTLQLICSAADMDNVYWQVVEYTDCNVQVARSTLNNGATSVSAFFGAVNQAKTMLITSQRFSGNMNADDLPRTEWNTASSITHTRVGTANNVDIITHVVEFTDNTDVQYGTIAVGAGASSATATTTSIDENATLAYGAGALGQQGSTAYNSDDNIGYNWFAVEQTNATTVTATRAQTGQTADVSYQSATFDFTPPETWYVFVDGNWNDPNTWTLDASTSPNYNNPSSEVPGPGDRVIIYNGRTVTVQSTTNNISINYIEVRGTLDLTTSTGHSFGSINGAGAIKIQGNNPGGGAVDNFPSGIINGSIGFADPSNGGTLIIEGSGDITMNQSRTIKNMKIERSAASDNVIMATDFTITGNLTVTTGDFQINTNSNNTPLRIAVEGDILVEANGSMSVGLADGYDGGLNGFGQWHQRYNTLTVSGDFTNNGSVRLTNQTNPNFANRTTTGAVSLVFNGLTNNTLSCNNTTDLYNLVIDKGVDRTYELQVFASDRSHFSLFGECDENWNDAEAAHPENRKALWIKNGSLRLTGQVYIPTLTEGGRDYTIGERAALILDGPDVYVGNTANENTDFTTLGLSYTAPNGVNNGQGQQALYPYGKLQINDGMYYLGEGEAINFRDEAPGIIEINGGELNANQVALSSAASLGNWSLIITGGILRLTSEFNPNGGNAMLNLDNSEMVFTMTGGEIIVEGVSGHTPNGIHILSSFNNINVTGGTLTVNVPNGTDVDLFSSAPFFNFNLANGNANLDSSFTVKNNFILSTGTLRTAGGDTYGTYFDCNNNNLTVGGDFRIERSAVYDFGTNTTTLNGNVNSVLHIGNTTTYTKNLTGFVDPEGANPFQDWEHPFYNLTIQKTGNATVTFSCDSTYDAGNNSTITDGNRKNIRDYRSNLVKVVNEFLLESGRVDLDLFSLRLYGDVTNKGVLGLDANPVNAQVKFRSESSPITRVVTTTSNSEFGNVRFNKGQGIVEFTSDVYIKRLLFKHGRLNIRNHNLRVDTLVMSLSSPAGSQFDVDNMIIMDGNASDGGFSLKVSALNNPGLTDPEAGNPSFNPTVYYFPIGVGTTGSYPASKFTPFNVRLASYSDDGYITVKTVSSQLATTGPHPLGNDVLNRYWSISHSGFTTVPKIDRYLATTNDADIPDGTNDAEMIDNGAQTWSPGYVLSNTPFTRTAESNNGATVTSGFEDLGTQEIRIYYFNNTTTNDASGNPAGGFDLIASDYSAGLAAKFSGSPTIYYSRIVSQNYGIGGMPQWSNGNTWSLTSHTGAAAGSFPQDGDIAIVGFGGTGGGAGGNRHHVAYRATDNYSPARVVVQASEEAGVWDTRLFIEEGATFNMGVVDGDGTIEVRLDPASPSTITGDFGSFVDSVAEGAQFLFHCEGGTQVQIPLTISELPNVRIEGGGNREVYFSQAVTIQGRLIVDFQARFRPRANVTVNDQMRLGQFREGVLIFPDDTTITVEVLGRLRLDSDADSEVQVENDNSAVARQHRLIVHEQIDLNQGNRFDLFNGNGANDDNVILEAKGTGYHWLGNWDNMPVELYRLVINKGSDTTNTFHIYNGGNQGITFGQAANGTEKPLEIVNGKFILDDPDVNITLSNGGELYYLPNLLNAEASSGSGALEVRQGSVLVEGDDMGIQLDGLLRVNGGTVDLDDVANNGNNFIEYGASGNAQLEVISGTLTVGSQVRRSPNNASGVLQYRQSGGNAIFGKNANPETSRGVFEVLNAGSVFELGSGANFTVVNDNSSGSVASLLLTPASHNVANGSTINLGNGDTQAGNDDFGINANIPLNKVIITPTNSPTVKIYSNILTLDTLEIGGGGNGTFDANGINLTINENLVNNGTFVSSGTTSNNQKTTFHSAANASISGSGTTTFWDFEKTGSGTLSLSKNITVSNNAFIRAGIFATGTSAVNLKKDLLHDAVHTSANAGPGIIFNGTSGKQNLQRSAPGESTFGVMELDNSAGLITPDNDENFRFTEKLILSAGVFDIGGNLVSIEENATIENAVGGVGLNDFNANNMIQTNSAIKDFGLRKFFNPVDISADPQATFTYPVGLFVYTPLVVTMDNIQPTNGANPFHITARPVADRPPITEDTENTGSCTDPNIVDADNVLQYYWILKSENVSNFIGMLETYYDNSDFAVTAPYSVANYGAARLYNTATLWDKIADQNSFDESNNRIEFPYLAPGNADNEIEGIYTAGVTLSSPTTLLCGAAIPDQVPQYITMGTGTNTFFNASSYTGAIAPPANTASDITVSSGFTLQIDQNGVRARTITIESGGTLEILSGVNNLNLGFVQGEGTLKLTSNTGTISFPNGDYDDFFPDASCNGGGGIEYAGSGSYNVLGGIPNIRRVIFSGSGNRTFPNNNTVNVCENLEMLNTVNTIIPDGNNNVIVRGNVIKSATAAFDNGGGSSRITMQGSAAQSIEGDFTGTNALNGLEINNTAGVSIINGTNDDVDLEGDLILSAGLLTTNNDNTLRVLNGGTISTFSASSYVNGPLVRELSAITGSFPFPVGSSGQYGRLDVVNPNSFTLTTTKDFTVNYFPTNPSAAADRNSIDASSNLDKISELEYWSVDCPSAAQSNIRIYWDSDSKASGNINNVEIAFWDGAQWTTAGSPSRTGDTLDGNILAGPISYSTKFITFGSSDSTATPLPVELVSFEGYDENNIHYLEWETANELNNSHFVVEHSLDGQTFANIGHVQGNGTSLRTQFYSFAFDGAQTGLNYYRLKQIDFDGSFEYSKTIAIEKASDKAVTEGQIRVYPNPLTDDFLIIAFSDLVDYTPIRIQLFNTVGQLLKEDYRVVEQGNTEIRLENISTDQKGFYLLRLQIGEQSITQKIIVN